ncbi:hypothetical protein PoB_006747700 [Plakobranchus ocellatus]|uniref:Uncharacterized protein n=1 Tax=Plakobranchus ocellatus TaxID=259542 RepID=A0AAV4DAB5_9GAST|nr:hypothetical protein PoB_006747700 [Plakobranchus ocellatus]
MQGATPDPRHDVTEPSQGQSKFAPKRSSNRKCEQDDLLAIARERLLNLGRPQRKTRSITLAKAWRTMGLASFSKRERPYCHSFQVQMSAMNERFM